MGNQQGQPTYDSLSTTSCALEDGVEQDPEPIPPPSSIILFSQHIEALCCPCTLTDDVLRQRKFFRVELPTVSAGDVFVLQRYTPVVEQSRSGPAAGLLNFFSSAAASVSSSSSSTTANDELEVQKLIGQPVFLSANLDLRLRFKMTANQTTTRGSINLADVHHFQSCHEGLELCFSCVDPKGKEIARFRANDTEKRDFWCSCLSNMISMYAMEIESGIGHTEKLVRRKQRQLEIAERRKRAKERINGYQLKGMKHSAIARSKR